MNELENAYERGTFGVSRRTFMKLAGVVGVTAMGGMLVFPDNEAHALYTEPAEQHWDALTGDKVRFTVHSDTHFNGCDVESKFPLAFKSIYSAVPDVQAHIFDGDSTNNGRTDEYNPLVNAINANLKKPPIICMGNHEIDSHSTYQGAIDEFKTFLTKITVEGAPQKPNGELAGEEHVHTTVGGYHVILASCGKSYYYDVAIPSEGYDGMTITDWLLREVEKAAADGDGKPIFVFTHHPMPHTMHFSPYDSEAGGWVGRGESFDAFRDTLNEKYPQVIHFSGHTHIPDNDPRSIWQDGFTAVQTATFGNNFWMEGGANKDGYDSQGGTGGHPSDGYDASQCLLVEVDPSNNHEVTIRRMDFREGGYIGVPWTFVPGDPDDRPYTNEKMEAANKAPIVDDDAKVLVSLTDPEPGQKAEMSFIIPADKVHPDTTGLADDIVMSYRIEIHSAADPEGEVIYNACYMSDYYKASQNRAAEFTRPLFGASLEAGDYVLTAYARNPWLKETQIGEPVEFTMPEIAAIPLTALLAVNFADGNAQDDSEFAHAVTHYGNPTWENVTEFGGKQVAVFSGDDSCYGYSFSQDDYDKLATSTTMEILLQVTQAPSGKNYKDVFSSGHDNGGQWLEYYGDQTLRHYHSDGSTCTSASVPVGEWAHIVATFDGQTMRYYKNGVEVDNLQISAPMTAPNSDSYSWFIGSDINKAGEPENFLPSKVAFANLYYGEVPDADAVAALYASAAIIDAFTPPAEGAFGSPEVGKLYTLPIVMATDVNGTQIQAVPSVTAPDGTEVAISRIEGEIAPQTDTVNYGFTPTQEGCHTVTYAAGYGATYAATFAVAAATAPDPEQPGTDPDQPGTDPEQPGTDPENPGTDPEKPGTGDGNQGGGSGNQGDSGSGSNNQGSGSGNNDPNQGGGSGSKGDDNKGSSLPQTADPMGAFTTAVGTVAALATVALGAAGAMAKKLGFDNGDSSDQQ